MTFNNNRKDLSWSAIEKLAVCRWIKTGHWGHKPVNQNDCMALSVLMAHVALVIKMHPDTLEQQLANHFNVPNLSALPASHFDAAILYMMALLPASPVA